ncbi:MAG TPA: UPF0182 family protein [Thermaerobacter sp.]
MHARRRWPIRPVIAVALVLAAWALGGLWSERVLLASWGYVEVFDRLLLYRLGGALAAGLVAAAAFVANLAAVARREPGSLAARRPLRWGLPLLAAVVAAPAGAAAGLRLMLALAAAGLPDPGPADPLFGRPLAWWIFWQPLLAEMVDFGQVLVFVLAAVTALLALWGAVGESLSGWQVTGPGGTRVRVLRVDGARAAPGAALAAAGTHLAVLAALGLVLQAARYRIAAWELVYSSRGPVSGAGFTDVHVTLPGLTALSVITLAAGAAVLYGARRRRWRFLLWTLAAWVVVSAAGLAALPAVVQRWIVVPDEFAREERFIARSIEATRRAFGIDRIRLRPHPAAPLDAARVAGAEDILANVRLWDWRLVQPVLTNQQALRPYYSFPDADADRYRTRDGYRMVLVAPREIDRQRLPNPTWVNRHLLYTHGHGLVAMLAGAVDGRGDPVLLSRDLPHRADDPAFALDRPQIYFGELPGDFFVTGTREREFDHPVSSDENAYTRFEGDTGIPLTPWNRVVFALREGALRLLTSGAISANSRLHLVPQVEERVQRVAPFLIYGDDPYPVVLRDPASGERRVWWVIEGYTATDRYPYSQRFSWRGRPVNYVRNSVKVTVDAYDGRVIFWAMDDDDPILAAYRRAFPELFRPAAEMPEELRAHLRYPDELLLLQARVLGRYHMTNPLTFYNEEDPWTISREKYGQAVEPEEMQPYYVITRLPGERELEFVSLLPMSPVRAGRDMEETRLRNMVALLVARSDPGHYGELIAYTFPKERLVPGPEFVEAMIDQDDAISPQLTLWDTGGSEVIRGHLLVIPIEDSLLYVEPLYLQATGNQIPELRRVIVSDGRRVVMAGTLEDGLRQLLGEEAVPRRGGEERGGESRRGDQDGVPPAGQAPPEPRSPGTEQGVPGAPETPGALPPGVEATLRRAVEVYREARQALQQGDYQRYGERLAELDRLMRELERQLGGQGAPGPESGEGQAGR